MTKSIIVFMLAGMISCFAVKPTNEQRVIPAAERTETYLPLLSGKRVALVANQTSCIGETHLADSLLSLGVGLVRIFSPEHGFRGHAGAGEAVESGIDIKTGLPVVSLYGPHKKPTAEDLSGTDIVLFDIQDVGVRFYTYISTMHYVMEACAENNVEIIVLDRPDPNGNYIDGPVLEKEFASFVGMDPVPVVYGMTIGEYARMVNGEGWLKDGEKCNLRVVPCLHYDHSTPYVLPVAPSPNLPDQQAVRLYPSLAFFEGTVISAGRGTPFPFRVFGAPSLEAGDFTFTPHSTPGVALHPKFMDQTCRGKDLRQYEPEDGQWDRIELQWLIWAYRNYEEKGEFFNAYFEKLAGTASLRRQIEEGLPEDSIRLGWAPGLEKFRKIREKYLLYE